jgi:hypothetical protein
LRVGHPQRLLLFNRSHSALIMNTGTGFRRIKRLAFYS